MQLLCTQTLARKVCEHQSKVQTAFPSLPLTWARGKSEEFDACTPGAFWTGSAAGSALRGHARLSGDRWLRLLRVAEAALLL